MDSLTDNNAIAAAVAWFAHTAGETATSDRAHATMVERTATQGQMGPLVRRDEDESYRVVDGVVRFFVDHEVVFAEPGDVVIAPAGAARTFKVESRAARWIVVTHVADVERFLDFGRAVSRPIEPEAREWPSQSELAAVTAIAQPNGIELLGPPGAVPDDPRRRDS